MALRLSTLDDESTLLSAARRGCTESFGELYQRYRTLAVSVARRALAGNRSWLAEDVAQTAFLEVLGALRNGAGPTEHLRPYLVTAVRRHAIRAAQGPALSSSPMMDDIEDVRSDEPMELDGRFGGHATLEEAFADLSPRAQTVLWATEVQGSRAADVAALLDVQPDAVYVLRHRARRRLARTYVAIAARSADPACRSALDELAGVLRSTRSPGAVVPGSAHIEECSHCRDVLRGIDVSTS